MVRMEALLNPDKYPPIHPSLSLSPEQTKPLTPRMRQIGGEIVCFAFFGMPPH